MASDTHRIVILGAPGSGKSVLAAYLLRSWPPDYVWARDPHKDPRFGRYKVCSISKPPPRRNVMIFIDEAEDLCPTSKKYPADWIRALVKQGRNNNQHWIMASKRPAEMSREVTSYASVAYVFVLADSASREYVIKDYGDRCEPIRRLERHQFLRVYPLNYHAPVTIHKLDPQIVASL